MLYILRAAKNISFQTGPMLVIFAIRRCAGDRGRSPLHPFHFTKNFCAVFGTHHHQIRPGLAVIIFHANGLAFVPVIHTTVTRLSSETNNSPNCRGDRPRSPAFLFQDLKSINLLAAGSIFFQAAIFYFLNPVFPLPAEGSPPGRTAQAGGTEPRPLQTCAGKREPHLFRRICRKDTPLPGCRPG